MTPPPPVQPSSGSSFPWHHIGLLALWVAIGAGLRFTHLTHKPLWTDEFSTLVFSLGNSFRTIPLNTVMSAETLLQPLQVSSRAGMGDVLHHLLTESNHPPLYFLLTHAWMGLFPAPSPPGWASVAVVRSLPALLGVFTIPALFALARLAFRSWPMAHLAALLMAISPFGVYLAQEARHYTLPLLWTIASLLCLTLALRPTSHPALLPTWLVLVWISINALGMATHYFFGLVLAAEGLAIVLYARLWHKRPVSLPWGGLSVVALGTVASALVWLPVIAKTQDSELTRWIYRGDRAGLAWLEPLGQSMAGWMTMLYLLPIQQQDGDVSLPWAIALVLLTLATGVSLLPAARPLFRAFPATIRLLGGYVMGAIALFWAITYITGMDITSAFRYNFVYFPGVIVLLGATLSPFWEGTRPKANLPLLKGIAVPGRLVVITILLFSLLGAITVVTNLGYQKTHRPDLMVQLMQQEGNHPPLVAIAHSTHGQTGRLMGIAWEWQRTLPDQPPPQFLLAHQDKRPGSPAIALRRALAQTTRPLDLWLINFRDVPPAITMEVLTRQGCTERVRSGSVDGYRYDLYRCE